MRKLILLLSHLAMLAFGFALGIYALPILTETTAPSTSELQAKATDARYRGEFVRDLEDSDLLHWGEGTVYIDDSTVLMTGKLAPGPDYRLYFSPQFVETEADFMRLKGSMREAAPITSFNNFEVALPADLNPDDYSSVIVWCERFSQFITAASYR